MKRLRTVLLIFAMMMLTACQSNAVGTLTLIKAPWTGDTSVQPEPTVNTYGGIANGVTLYDDPEFGSITVDRQSGAEIGFRINHSRFVEETDDGTIDLMAKPLETITIKRGEEKVIVTQTMDGGIRLTLKYE